jgi:hypothetical protein
MFKQGDKVRHRASGEIGIITVVVEACFKHNHLHHMNGYSNDCYMEKSDCYDVSLGFDNNVKYVSGYLLELVDEEELPKIQKIGYINGTQTTPNKST